MRSPATGKSPTLHEKGRDSNAEEKTEDSVFEVKISVQGHRVSELAPVATTSDTVPDDVI